MTIKQEFKLGDVVNIIAGSFEDQLAIVVKKDKEIELDFTKIHVKLCKNNALLIMPPHILRKVIYPECEFKVGDRVTSNCSPFENGTVTKIDYKKIIMGTTPDDDFLYSYTIYVLIDNEKESSQYIQDELHPLNFITEAAAVDVLKSEMTVLAKNIKWVNYETARLPNSCIMKISLLDQSNHDEIKARVLIRLLDTYNEQIKDFIWVCVEAALDDVSVKIKL